MVLPIIFFSSISFANEIDTPTKENDSMYRYNALENKSSFINFSNNNVDNLAEKSEKINTLPEVGTNKLQDITDKQNYSDDQSSQQKLRMHYYL